MAVFILEMSAAVRERARLQAAAARAQLWPHPMLFFFWTLWSGV
jgi:hypothetical protein